MDVILVISEILGGGKLDICRLKNGKKSKINVDPASRDGIFLFYAGLT
jgi:hypothetical protein